MHILSDVFDKVVRGTNKLLEQFVDVLELAWLVARGVQRVEVLLE